jgi:hypothetical protein
MLTFFKTLAAITIMVMIIPLAVWGGSGSRRQAWQGLKGYLIAMAVIVVPAVLIAALGWLWYFIN